MAKRYDKAYFDRWYRDPRHRQWAIADVARKVRMAVGVAEWFLERPLQSVLDVGCGEASWQRVLSRMRPGIRYLGVDGSDYVVERFGAARNIVKGTLGGLAELRLKQRFDLVVCCDVLHYVTTPEIRRGLRELVRLTRGPAYLEAYTSADDVTGDNVDFQPRSPATYRRLFAAAGFTHVGPHCYVGPDMKKGLVELEKPR